MRRGTNKSVSIYEYSELSFLFGFLLGWFFVCFLRNCMKRFMGFSSYFEDFEGHILKCPS